MCGNIWEHVGGIRFMDGQVQVIPDNGAAAGADQSRDSKEWQAIHTADGDPVYYKVEDGEISLQPVTPDCKDYDGVEFKDLNAEAMDVPEKLIELGLYPAPGYEGTDYFWLDTDGERIVFRGGNWYSGANAGVFSSDGTDSRASVYWSVGFRSALVRYSGDSGDLDNLDDETTDLSDAPQEIKDEIKANAEKLERKETMTKEWALRKDRTVKSVSGMGGQRSEPGKRAEVRRGTTRGRALHRGNGAERPENDRTAPQADPRAGRRAEQRGGGRP